MGRASYRSVLKISDLDNFLRVNGIKFLDNEEITWN